MQACKVVLAHTPMIMTDGCANVRNHQGRTGYASKVPAPASAIWIRRGKRLVATGIQTEVCPTAGSLPSSGHRERLDSAACYSFGPRVWALEGLSLSLLSGTTVSN